MANVLYSNMCFFHSMKPFEHGVCLMVVGLGFAANLALNIENNDSRLVHIPKQEFVRVLSDIVSGSSRPEHASETVADSLMDGDDDEEEDDVHTTLLSSARARRGAAGSAGAGTTSLPSPYDIGTSSAAAAGNSGRSSGRSSAETPRSAALKYAQSSRNSNGGGAGAGAGFGLGMGAAAAAAGMKKRRVKSDSLFFLQRSMEQREDQYRRHAAGFQQG